MSATEYQLTTYDTQLPEELPQKSLADGFLDNISDRMHGENLARLMEAKPNVKQTVSDFAYDMLPEEAVSIAEIAHLAELTHHEGFGKNIRRSLHESIFSKDTYTDEQKLYIAAIFSDLTLIASYAKAVHKDTHTPVDLASLATAVESINIESVILKSALDYSNFQLLEAREKLGSLTEKETGKMERTVAAKRYIDTVLLEVLGFDALAAEMLSRVYEHQLRKDGHEQFIDRAETLFDELGGRELLGNKAGKFLGQLFSHDMALQYHVTHNQTAYNMHFTDGMVSILDGQDVLQYRTLTRLKSVGSTAIKMRNATAKYPDQPELGIPADIIGVTFIAENNETMEKIVEHVLDQLSNDENVQYVSAPSRDEPVHVKGTQQFIDLFTRESSVFSKHQLPIDTEVCTNGYEAGKLTVTYDGCPIEMQFTHKTSREASRTGLGSHTLFKMMKVVGINPESKLTKDQIVSILENTAKRKEDFSSDSLTIVPDSKQRAESLISLCRSEANRRDYETIHKNNRIIGNTALHIVK